MLKIDDCRAYKLSYLLLRIPIAPGHYTFVQLRGGEHQLSMLRDPSLKLGALLITPDCVDIMVSKEVLEPMKTEGKDAYDLNIANVTGVSTGSKEPTVYDVSDIVRFNKKYSEVLSHFRRNDRRIGKKLAAKYGRKRRDKTRSLLHLVSKRIVQSAAKDKHTIVLEKLTHIRKRHERGRQKERRATRHAINTWPFWILQKAIKYKAAWEQIPVEFIDPKNTSRTCSACGSVNKKLRFEREWRCPSCGAMLSRDVNAARNLLNRSLGVQAMRFVAGGLAGEAMVRGAHRGAPPIVDASQPDSPSARAVSPAESVVQLGSRK